MSAHRAEQISQVILAALNEYLIKEAEPPRDTLTTITKVDVTDDLEHAFVWLSILPVDKAGTALAFFKRNLYDAKKYIKKHTALRMLPELHLKIDDDALKYRKIEREIEKLHQEK